MMRWAGCECMFTSLLLSVDMRSQPSAVSRDREQTRRKRSFDSCPGGVVVQALGWAVMGHPAMDNLGPGQRVTQGRACRAGEEYEAEGVAAVGPEVTQGVKRAG